MPKTAPRQLLLLHGFRGNHLGLAAIQKSLEQAGYQVFVPDIPPALSEKTKKRKSTLTSFTKPGYADWIADYIKTNQLHQPLLIGHSMGSILAAIVAEQYPQLVANQVIFLAPISVKPPRLIRLLSPLCVVLPNILVDFVTTRYLLVKKSAFREVLALTHQCSKNNTSKLDIAKAGKFSCKYSISDFNLAKKQTYFIAGEKDRLTSQIASQKTAKQFNGKIFFIPNAGHLINYECPELVATKIKEILKEK